MKTNYEIREVHLLVRTQNIHYCNRDCNYLSVFRDDQGRHNQPSCTLFNESLQLTPKKTKINRCQHCSSAEFPTLSKFCRQKTNEDMFGRKIKLTPLSKEAHEARLPQKPAELLGALDGKVHKDLGRSRAVEVVRVNRKGKIVK